MKICSKKFMDNPHGLTSMERAVGLRRDERQCSSAQASSNPGHLEILEAWVSPPTCQLFMSQGSVQLKIISGRQLRQDPQLPKLLATIIPRKTWITNHSIHYRTSVNLEKVRAAATKSKYKGKENYPHDTPFSLIYLSHLSESILLSSFATLVARQW